MPTHFHKTDLAANQHFAIILAAGFSTRMGICKTTLLWHNHQTLLRYQTEQFLQAGINPVVVLGEHNAHRQEDCAAGTTVVVKGKEANSKAQTILAGLAQLPEAVSTITISAVDQPRAASVYSTLLQAHQQENALITAPSYGGKLGHPIFFSHHLRTELAHIRDESLGLRRIIQANYADIYRAAFSTSEVLVDINDKQSYERCKPDIVTRS